MSICGDVERFHWFLVSRIVRKHFMAKLHCENIAMWNMELVKFVRECSLGQQHWLDIMSIIKTSKWQAFRLSDFYGCLDLHHREYFKCHTCQKVLSSVGTYKNHLSEHTGNYRFSCDFCEKKFNIKLSYDEHLRGHDMVTRAHTTHSLILFVNNEEKKRFSLLQKKKYICHICGQGFIHSATFLIHKIWHTNPMP